MSDTIRVVVVDKAPLRCRFMATALASASGIHVVGTAHNGTGAAAVVKELRPDVVLLDLEMPDRGGLTVLDQVMHDCPTPVVVVVSQQAAALALEAVKLGAVDFLLYTAEVDTDLDAVRQRVLAKVRAATRIRVVRSLHLRKERSGAAPEASRAPLASVTRASTDNQDTTASPESVVVIGASTGGPPALREVLGGIPADFPAAIIVVQHMPEHFTAVLAAQLDRYVAMTVREAQDGDRLRPGTVLVAPGGYHLTVSPEALVQLTKGLEVGGHRPAIDVTMRSVAEVYGARAQGVVLTGMGADGALGLAAIHAKGGMTFAQEATSCVINGMPQRARDLGAVDYVDTPAQIARRLLMAQQQLRRDTTW